MSRLPRSTPQPFPRSQAPALAEPRFVGGVLASWRPTPPRAVRGGVACWSRLNDTLPAVKASAAEWPALLCAALAIAAAILG